MKMILRRRSFLGPMVYRRFLSTAGLTFRDATSDDRDEVLSLRKNVYRGLDYLPDYYDFFLQDTNRRCIVGQLHSKIVTFGVMLTLDDGMSVLGQAGRVHEQFEGRGFFSALSQHINDLAKASGCKQRVALVETTLNKYARSEKFRKTHVEITSKLHYAGIITEQLRHKLEKNKDVYTTLTGSDITQADTSILQTLFASESLRHYLFPHGRLLVDYMPYRVIPNNIIQLNGRNTSFYSSVKTNWRGVNGLLSAGTYYKCENPSETYTIDLFGNDVESLEKHVMFHLLHAIQVTSGHFCVQIFVGKGYVAQKLCDLLINLDVPKCNWYVNGGVSTKSIVEEPFHG